jgi:hypothetical protein
MFMKGEARLRHAMLGSLGSLLLVLQAQFLTAAAQEHRHHPPEDMAIHERFYSTWFMPDQPSKSCCNKADCYATEIKYVDGQIYARRREDGRWLPIPARKVERNRDNPDGRNHLCAPPPSHASNGQEVYCFALGGGT